MNKVFIYIISCGSTLISEDKRKFQKKLYERKVKSKVQRKKKGNCHLNHKLLNLVKKIYKLFIGPFKTLT